MQLITSKEVRARFGGISRVTLMKYRKIGKIPKPVIDTTQPRWDEAQIEEALQALRG